MKDNIDFIIRIAGICAIITIVWQLIEYIIYGEIIPNKADTVIALVLALSLNRNLNTWEDKKVM